MSSSMSHLTNSCSLSLVTYFILSYLLFLAGVTMLFLAITVTNVLMLHLFMIALICHLIRLLHTGRLWHIRCTQVTWIPLTITWHLAGSQRLKPLGPSMLWALAVTHNMPQLRTGFTSHHHHFNQRDESSIVGQLCGQISLLMKSGMFEVMILLTDDHTTLQLCHFIEEDDIGTVHLLNTL